MRQIGDQKRQPKAKSEFQIKMLEMLFRMLFEMLLEMLSEILFVKLLEIGI